MLRAGHAVCAVAMSAALLAATGAAHAADGRGAADVDRAELPAAQSKGAWKLTPAHYMSSSEPDAWDVNLRGNTETQTWWAGYYQRKDEFRQLRLGYERPLEWPLVRIVPSFQYATRGFLGGSLYSEIGERHFAIAGWGRTNLR